MFPASVLGLQTAVFSLSIHIISPLRRSVSVPKLPLFLDGSHFGSGPPTNDLTLITSVKTLSPNKVTF